MYGVNNGPDTSFNIIAQHNVVQTFHLRENNNDLFLIWWNLQARGILHGTDNIVLSQIPSLVTRSSSKH